MNATVEQESSRTNLLSPRTNYSNKNLLENVIKLHHERQNALKTGLYLSNPYLSLLFLVTDSVLKHKNNNKDYYQNPLGF